MIACQNYNVADPDIPELIEARDWSASILGLITVLLLQRCTRSNTIPRTLPASRTKCDGAPSSLR